MSRDILEGRPIVLRPIIDFHQDEALHWVAALTCGHCQHTRHDPPFFPRPWVITEAGRQAHLGTSLNCVLCDRQELPEGFVPYQQTPIFDNQTIPEGLRKNHSTKPGVWGMIHVKQGKLKYRIYEPLNTEVILSPRTPGIVLPEVEHDVQLFDNTQFYVEFWHHPINFISRDK